MSSVFTEFVRALEPRAELPDAELFTAVWQALRRALAAELRRRGLWGAPPSYLGVFGPSGWQAPRRAVGSPVTPGTAADDPLEELAADCYTFVFIDRFRSLKAHSRTKETIDGLVVLSVRNFVHDRQKSCDPLGFRVFELLRAAVDRMVAGGRLHLVDGDRTVRNDTVLTFAPGPMETSGPDPPELAELLGRWGEELIPDILVARGASLEALGRSLERRLTRLADRGVARVSFRDLVDPLKAGVRRGWAAAWQHGEGDGDAAGLVAPPSEELEEREMIAKLAVCVERSFARIDDRRRRQELSRLWRLLRLCADEARHGGGNGRIPLPAVPSQRTLARLLGIPRRRLPELLGTLGTTVEECRQALREVAGRNDRPSGHDRHNEVSR